MLNKIESLVKKLSPETLSKLFQKQVNVETLLNQLLKDTMNAVSRYNISVESKTFLAGMYEEIAKYSKFEKQYKIVYKNKNEKLTKLLIGAIIFVLAYEDQKYKYTGENQLYPNVSLETLFKQYDKENPSAPERSVLFGEAQKEEETELYPAQWLSHADQAYNKARGVNNGSYIDFMNWLGTKAMLDQIPFAADLIKRKVSTSMAILTEGRQHLPNLPSSFLNKEIVFLLIREAEKTRPFAIFHELAGNSDKLDQVISLVKPHIQAMFKNKKYITAYKRGAALGLFFKSDLKPALPHDIINYIADNFLDSKDVSTMVRTCKDVRNFALEARQDAMKIDSLKDDSSSISQKTI